MLYEVITDQFRHWFLLTYFCRIKNYVVGNKTFVKLHYNVYHSVFIPDKGFRNFVFCTTFSIGQYFPDWQVSESFFS